MIAYAASSMTAAPRTYAPDAAALERLADRAVARLPGRFRAFLDGVVVRVEEEAEDEVLRELGLDSPYELTGLYSGRSMREESQWASGELRPMIHLYRRALLLEWVETGVALEELIAHVIVHEVGHHFGLSDEEMHAIEEQA